MRDRLLLAEAEAGWRNWEGVVSALSPDGTRPATAPPRYWLLLGTALAETGDDEDAEAALARFLEDAAPEDRRRAPALSRWIRLGAPRRPAAETEAALATLRAHAPVVADWTALEAARALAAAGRPEAAGRLRADVRDPSVRQPAWSLVADAWAAAGDTAAALAALDEIAPAGPGPPSPVQLAARRWRWRLALADTSGALAEAARLVGETTRGSSALAAAKALRSHGRDLDADLLRRVATALGNGGEFGPAVLAWNVAVEAGAVLAETERLALARALGGSGSPGDAVSEYRRLAESRDAATAARALSAWAGVRRRQGRHDDARTVEGWLVERFPSSRQAVDVVFFRADDAHDAGRLREALGGYREVAAMSPSADRAGLARMRWGQIHLARGEADEARAVFEGYLADFPNGRRWEEAAFWAAQAASETGDTTASRGHAERILRESPLSYYAFLASGGPDTWAAAESAGADAAPFAAVALGMLRDPAATPLPPWLEREMDVLRMLEDAQLRDAAALHVEAMTAAAGDSDDLLFALAAALGEAGRARDAITLGWELRRRGRAWDRPLLRLVFPFPHRELVEARAAELGLDPFLVAGLIRQESAFDAQAVSSAGAIGLMQVVPATGRQLARTAGPPRFTAGFLAVPELNVHLGALFLAELVERYDGDVPLVLSAYNAGPTRANRWRRFPEAEDARRFTERIPFFETRAYVKNVVRNRALYAWLYGGERPVHPDAAVPGQ